MNCTVLSIKRRFESYETIGQLFKNCKDLVLEQTLIERIWQLFKNTFKSLFSELGVDWENLISIILEKRELFVEQCNKNFETFFAFDVRQ